MNRKSVKEKSQCQDNPHEKNATDDGSIRDKKMTYKLPDGQTTDDADVYGDAWQEVAEQIEAALDVHVYAMNPGLMVRGNNGHETATIPLWLARRIVNLARETEKAEQEETP